MTLDLFDDDSLSQQAGREPLGPGAIVLRGFVRPHAAELLSALERIVALAPFRHMETPGGFRMSVALSNCGELGWTSDRHGYRYTPRDPETGRPWPPMPSIFLAVAQLAAAEAGQGDFTPDACLINRYEPGARLSMHQDRDEIDFGAPIVSVSLGVPAVFLFGGHKRSDKANKVLLMHGDVVVWGGPDRLRYHGVLPLKEAQHPLLGARRVNLTFRKAG